MNVTQTDKAREWEAELSAWQQRTLLQALQASQLWVRSSPERGTNHNVSE